MEIVTKDAFQVLEETSRTFFIPIVRLPDRLRETVASAYLCMRSIDEVEDQHALDAGVRAELLRSISRVLQAARADFDEPELRALFQPHGALLPEVTQRLGEWCRLAPADIRARVWDSTAAMADRMADWVQRGFTVTRVADLDRYTYAVAGGVGVLLCDLWCWFDGTPSDRSAAIAFGRGLQAVNILRNRDEDLANGVDFYPPGWNDAAMHAYAGASLEVADGYAAALPAGPIRDFCALPLRLAHATQAVLQAGRRQLTRDEVIALTTRAP